MPFGNDDEYIWLLTEELFIKEKTNGVVNNYQKQQSKAH